MVIAIDIECLLNGGTASQLKAQAETLLKVGVNVNLDSLHNLLGKRVEHLVAHWFRYYAWSGASLLEVADFYERRFLASALQAGSRPEIFAELVAISQNSDVVLLSTWKRQIVLELLHAFEAQHGYEVSFLVDTLFTSILCDDECSCYKPGTETLGKLADDFGIGPRDIAVLESSPNGVEATRRFGAIRLSSLKDFRNRSLIESFGSTSAQL